MESPEFSRRSRVFRTIFTWNKIIKIERSIPIGDPFLYLRDDCLNFTVKESIVGTDIAILLPKFRRRLNPKDRLYHYTRLIKEAKDRFPNKVLLLKLHQTENDFWKNKIAQIIAFKEVDFLNAKITNSLHQSEEIVNMNTILKSPAPILSDYLGPHVFRRIVKYNQEVLLCDQTYQYPAISPLMKELVESFTSNQGNLKEQRIISNIILGTEYLRNPSELGQLLGLSGPRGVLSPVIKEIYFKWTKGLNHGRI